MKLVKFLLILITLWTFVLVVNAEEKITLEVTNFTTTLQVIGENLTSEDFFNKDNYTFKIENYPLNVGNHPFFFNLTIWLVPFENVTLLEGFCTNFDFEGFLTFENDVCTDGNGVGTVDSFYNTSLNSSLYSFFSTPKNHSLNNFEGGFIAVFDVGFENFSFYPSSYSFGNFEIVLNDTKDFIPEVFGNVSEILEENITIPNPDLNETPNILFPEDENLTVKEIEEIVITSGETVVTIEKKGNETLDLSKMKIHSGEAWVAVKGINITKTIRMKKKFDSGTVCVRDVEINEIGGLNETCTLEGETGVKCDIPGSNCRTIGEYYVITGLNHTLIREMPKPPIPPPRPPIRKITYLNRIPATTTTTTVPSCKTYKDCGIGETCVDTYTPKGRNYECKSLNEITPTTTMPVGIAETTQAETSLVSPQQTTLEENNVTQSEETTPRETASEDLGRDETKIDRISIVLTLILLSIILIFRKRDSIKKTFKRVFKKKKKEITIPKYPKKKKKRRKTQKEKEYY